MAAVARADLRRMVDALPDAALSAASAALAPLAESSSRVPADASADDPVVAQLRAAAARPPDPMPLTPAQRRALRRAAAGRAVGAKTVAAILAENRPSPTR